MQKLSNHGGYDQPIRQEKEDFFGRGRLASELWEIAGNSPKDWSVRIGLYGKWGEGKTSVLHLLEGLANNERHIITWFNPWSIRNRENLWREFAGAIFSTLEEHGIKIEDNGEERLLDHAKKLPDFLKKILDAGKSVSGFVGGSLALFGELFAVNGETFKKIQKQLGNRRLIVIIDDLDRSDPSLLPELLLTLREILDIPGFTFVLAFDIEIVAKALASQYMAWETGEEFLEKIIDFPFVLPLPTDAQLKQFLEHEIGKDCDFIDKELLNEILPLLPKNPRKIKLFVRHIWTLKKQVCRYYDWELDWPSIFILQLLKIESAHFCRHLSQHPEFLSKISVWQLRKTHGGKAVVEEEEKVFKQELMEIIKKLNLKAQIQTDRICFLVMALAEKNNVFRGHSLLYSINLVDQSPAFTLKEIQEVFEVWKKSQDLKSVNDWIENHSKKISFSVVDVEGEIFENLVNFRLLRLDEAADSWEMDQYSAIMADVDESLEFLNALVAQGLAVVGKTYFQVPKNFQQLWKMVGKWSHFTNNPADQKARVRENEVLSKFFEFAEKEASAYLKVLQPWEVKHGLGEELNRDLAKSLEKKLLPHVADDILKEFEGSRALTFFGDPLGHSSEIYVIFNIQGPLWIKPRREKIFAIWKTASENPGIHENCVRFLQMISSGLRNGIGIPYGTEEIKNIVKDKELIGSLWESAMARRIQFRSLKNVREIRDQFIEIVQEESIFPMPDWLLEDSVSEGVPLSY